MFEYDLSLLPTAIDITLYKYNYIDNKIFTQLNNQVDFIQVDSDSIIVSSDQLKVFLEENYQSELNKFKSIGTDIIHKEINSTFFLHKMCEEMENLKYVKITLNKKKGYSRTVELDGNKVLQFNFKIMTATIRLSDIFSDKDLLSANKALEKIGILRDGTPFVRIKGKDLGSLIDSNMENENKDFAPLLDILDILEHKMEQDDSLILLITDY
jgi:hypothetical protein|tara:strand:+ start:4536 stop:5171 length:636 start_codon:yes stop_codon:yes gene_type:complete